MSEFVRACRVSDVAPESAIPVEIGGTELAIVHSDGQFYAIADECSHASIPLSEGDVGDGEIECYLHGSRFDLRTGQPTGLPATEPVAIYRCSVQGDDVLVDVSSPVIAGRDDPPDPPLQAVASSLETQNTQES
jgi:3-phenylpropionate/trans-cinnamate dioxygenase ferredoxin component